jgi:hypothetical protein
MTPNDIIITARKSLQDSLFLRGPDKYVADTLLNYVNMAVRKMVMMRPDLFTKLESNFAVPQLKVDRVLQTCPTDSYRLVEIFTATNGGNVVVLEEVDYAHFVRADRSWSTHASAIPTKYMRHPRNPNKFFLYPKPSTGTSLQMEYIKVQSAYTLNETIEGINDNYFPALVDAVVYYVLTIENAESSSGIGIGRANMYLNTFYSAIDTSADSRLLTDVDNLPMQPRRLLNEAR